MTTPPPTRPAHPPDVRRTLPWRDWTGGLSEAADRGVPIVCLAEAAWSTGAQRLALVLEHDDETRGLLETAFVPVLVDPVARPDVAAHLRWAATVLTGTAGPPLIAILTPGGSPFLAYCSLWPEGRSSAGGRTPYPSLRSLLRSLASLGPEHPAAMEAEANGLRTRTATAPHPPGSWAAVRGCIDERFGGLQELPKHPHAPLLWRLLEEADEPAVRAHLLRTLDGMQRGGILDQLGDSFHRCARDERWVVPHFEKLVPVNAALAAVYARATQTLERADYAATARGAADFALAGLDSDAMVVGADAGYYTWTTSSFQQALDPTLVQALGLHFRIARDDAPQVLFRAMDSDAMAEVADVPAAVLESRIRGGKARLALARVQRPAPGLHRIDAPAWRAETLRWLFEARRHGLVVDDGRLEAHLTRLLDGPFDPALGYARGVDDAHGGTAAHWLEDQAAIAAACLAATAAVPAAHATAVQLAALIVDAYQDPEAGHLSDAPRQGVPSHDVVDHALSAALPTAAAVLAALGADPAVASHDRTRFRTAAERVRRWTHRPDT